MFLNKKYSKIEIQELFRTLVKIDEIDQSRYGRDLGEVTHNLNFSDYDEVDLNGYLIRQNETEGFMQPVTNQIIPVYYNREELITSGLTNVFNNPFSSTNIDVYLAGIKQNPTITTSEITFYFIPRRGQILEIKQETTTTETPEIYMELYRPKLFYEFEELQNILDMNLKEINNFKNSTYQNHLNKQRIIDTKHSLELTFKLQKDTKSFLEEWKDKVFRIRYTQSDGQVFYLTPSRIQEDTTTNIYDNTQSITILSNEKIRSDI